MLRGLTDHPPARLRGVQRATWERLYVQSEAIAASGAWGDEGYTWPAHVANKIVNDLWTPSGRPRALPRPGLMPAPGDMIAIGFFVEAHYWDGRRIAKLSMRLPVCLWSDHLRAVVVFRRMQIPEATYAAKTAPQLLALYRKWHDGKDPKAGWANMTFEAPRFSRVFPCVDEVYRSDKFDDDFKYTDYVHHHDKGVLMAGGRGPGPMLFVGPEAIMIRGGRLALTSRGLIH